MKNRKLFVFYAMCTIVLTACVTHAVNRQKLEILDGGNWIFDDEHRFTKYWPHNFSDSLGIDTTCFYVKRRTCYKFFNNGRLAIIDEFPWLQNLDWDSDSLASINWRKKYMPEYIMKDLNRARLARYVVKGNQIFAYTYYDYDVGPEVMKLKFIISNSKLYKVLGDDRFPEFNKIEPWFDMSDYPTAHW